MSAGTAAVQDNTQPDADYYVDPTLGSDSNSGTTKAAPFRHLPNDSNATGVAAATSMASKIFEIKSGETIVPGGNTFYFDVGGTLANPTIVQVSDDWGTGGDVVIDQSGKVAPDWDGLMRVRANYVILRGSTGGLNGWLRRTGGDSGVSTIGFYAGAGGGTTDYTGIQLHYFSSKNHADYGSAIGRTIDFYASHCEFNDNYNQCGMLVGFAGDIPNTNFLFENTDFNNNGNMSVSDNDLPHGCQFTGPQVGVTNFCKATGNRRDGFDCGIAYNGGSAVNYDMDLTVLNSDLYGNGEDGLGCNNQASNTGNVHIKAINSILHNNAQGTQPYDGVQLEMYHCVLTLNGTAIYANNYSCGTPYITNTKLRNTIIAYNQPAQDIYGPNCSGSPGTMDPTFDSDGNIWVPAASDSEVGWNVIWAGPSYNYTSPPSYVTANTDQYGLAADPGFANVVSEFASCDFHIAQFGSADGTGVSTAGFPTEALTDREGNLRSTTAPNVGLYESFAP